MSLPYTLQFGTYSFPNQTFELEGHRLQSDVPTSPIRRMNGGVVLQGNLLPKTIVLNGRMFSSNIDVLHESMNIMKQALHNAGLPAWLQYRSDRQVWCQIAPSSIDAIYEKGLYQYLANVKVTLMAPRPFAQSTSSRTVTGTRTNNSALEYANNLGHYPTNPVFTFVNGTWAFSNNIFVQNNGNCLSFNYQGPMVAGQTLVIDCDLGCVLLQVGLTMVDATSYFAGDLFFQLDPTGTNTLIITAASLSYSVLSYDRYYL